MIINCSENIQDYDEWMYYSLRCEICDKVMCWFCFVQCYDCSAEVGYTITYCTNCVPKNYYEVDCEYHNWWTCGKHSGKCGQCEANYNFSMRYQ